jgi:hypothetical protein
MCFCVSLSATIHLVLVSSARGAFVRMLRERGVYHFHISTCMVEVVVKLKLVSPLTNLGKYLLECRLARVIECAAALVGVGVERSRFRVA